MMGHNLGFKKYWSISKARAKALIVESLSQNIIYILYLSNSNVEVIIYPESLVCCGLSNF